MQPMNLPTLLDDLYRERYSGTLTLHCKDGVPVEAERRFKLETAEASLATQQHASPETTPNVSPAPSGAGNGKRTA
jgi:hypothetical protein